MTPEGNLKRYLSSSPVSRDVELQAYRPTHFRRQPSLDLVAPRPSFVLNVTCLSISSRRGQTSLRLPWNFSPAPSLLLVLVSHVPFSLSPSFLMTGLKYPLYPPDFILLALPVPTGSASVSCARRETCTTRAPVAEDRSAFQSPSRKESGRPTETAYACK